MIRINQFESTVDVRDPRVRILSIVFHVDTAKSMGAMMAALLGLVGRPSPAWLVTLVKTYPVRR